MPHAYVIAEIEITNSEGYKAYAQLVPATVKQFGGEFIVRGGASEALEGDWPARRRVVIRFPSKEAARQWYDSPEYQPALKLRQANSNGRLLLIEGVE